MFLYHPFILKNYYSAYLYSLTQQNRETLNSTEKIQNVGKNQNSQSLLKESPQKVKKLGKKVKKQCFEQKKSSRNRNLSSIILKSFIKRTENYQVYFYEIAKTRKNYYSLEEFFQEFKKKFPTNQSYVRPSTVREVCSNQEGGQFTDVFRRMLRHFLLNEYPRCVLEKKKKKISHLKEIRVLYQKIFL